MDIMFGRTFKLKVCILQSCDDDEVEARWPLTALDDHFYAMADVSAKQW
jgi:hypothetical protein